MKKRERMKPKCTKSLFKGKRSHDQDCGQRAQRQNVSRDKYEKEKKIFLDSLVKSDEQRQAMKRSTVMQQYSGEWLEERRKLLTSSNFGTVCKHKPHTGCENLVKQMLYGKCLQTQQMIFGQTNERTAIRELERKENIVLQCCGLVTDKNMPYLGSSPDGLIENNGVVEVKCPWSAAEMTPEEALTAGKITVLKQTKNGIIINKTRSWFYQIQIHYK
ncbi:hypothetical protein PR048_028536 [Dryococelus australis]|uniref:YqaJ viral recombinase domain-containing protein n=1 Tax=Dryococelus australis TaxID=614101 RepID=A0ABQ9GAV0_9NEOP|nr:hypothetical protein PR048_028536 [Dryococelus australis]